MKRNFCSFVVKDLDSSITELKNSLILSEALSIEELDALYASDKVDEPQQIAPQKDQIKPPAVKPQQPASVVPETDRPLVASDDVSFTKDIKEPDSYVVSSDKPYKLKFLSKNPNLTQPPKVTTMKEEISFYSPDIVLSEEDDVIAPIETAPLEVQKEVEEPETKVIKITVETEPSEEEAASEKDSEKDSEEDSDEDNSDEEYDMVSGLPGISKEELAQLASIVSALNPKGKVVMTPASQMLRDAPLGSVNKIMTPEEDPDGISVAGLDNDIGMLLM